MKKILFLCTGNSCRSQMAEGLGNHFKGEMFDFCSAGSVKHGLNQRAVKVMKEEGIDISTHYSKTLEDFNVEELDYVITVCGDANETCPIFLGKTKVVHIGFDDPPRLTSGMDNEEEILKIYRRVMNEIKEAILNIENLIN